MEIKKVKKHTCKQGRSPKNCNCRKYISETEAAILLKNGRAERVIVGWKEFSVDCPVCLDGKYKDTCDYCQKTGRVRKKDAVEGDDITVVLETNRKVTKTPRSPTIERGHIERAFDDFGAGGRVAEAARNRIAEYQLITLKEKVRLLVKNYDAEIFEAAWRVWEAGRSAVEILNSPFTKFPIELRTEPSDDRKNGVGRYYDYGRPV